MSLSFVVARSLTRRSAVGVSVAARPAALRLSLAPHGARLLATRRPGRARTPPRRRERRSAETSNDVDEELDDEELDDEELDDDEADELDDIAELDEAERALADANRNQALLSYDLLTLPGAHCLAPPATRHHRACGVD